MKRSIAAMVASVSLILTVSGCHGMSGSVLPGQAYSPGQSSLAMMTGLRPDIAPWSGKIKHIIIIFQENRSLDNMFNGYPGADTQSWGLDHSGNHIPLTQVSETAPYDISHAHSAFTTEYAGGKMNGFDLVQTSACGKPGACPPQNRRAYGMVPRTDQSPTGTWPTSGYWATGCFRLIKDRASRHISTSSVGRPRISITPPSGRRRTRLRRSMPPRAVVTRRQARWSP